MIIKQKPVLTVVPQVSPGGQPPTASEPAAALPAEVTPVEVVPVATAEPLVPGPGQQAERDLSSFESVWLRGWLVETSASEFKISRPDSKPPDVRSVQWVTRRLGEGETRLYLFVASDAAMDITQAAEERSIEMSLPPVTDVEPAGTTDGSEGSPGNV